MKRPFPTWVAGLLFAVFGVLLAGCQQLPAVRNDSAGEYRLGPGDVLQVAVNGQQDMSGKFTVDPTGHISMVHAGAVLLNRKTLREAELAITEKLKVELKSPVVAVNILQYRPVFVTGEVRNSGGYPYLSGLTVRQAIAMAGGYTPRASRNKLSIVREGGPKAVAAEDTVVSPGDTVEVGESLF
jgi:polysaccharide export outer membrane protein